MPQTEDSFEQLLNVGCGRRYHSAWSNIDLSSCGPEVRQYDLRRGLPYEDGNFDAVYHSHVLEHLTPEDAIKMLDECYRVLRPGGVIRVVVPDLEGIARAYLKALESAVDQDEMAIANQQWMTLELIDQMTRQRGGGEMGRVMSRNDQLNRHFIRERMGHQMDESSIKVRKTVATRLRRLLQDVRKQVALTTVTLLEGQAGRAAYREGRFRQSGEVHRWMYDRISLSRLLQEVGFESPTVCSAEESRITEFDSYQLDREGTEIRKPDSLYIEAVKTSPFHCAPHHSRTGHARREFAS